MKLVKCIGKNLTNKIEQNYKDTTAAAEFLANSNKISQNTKQKLTKEEKENVN